NSFITWMLVAGFIGGHVLDEIFYHPDEIVKNPLSLLMLWQGLSSFGGFIGAPLRVLLFENFLVLPPGEGGGGQHNLRRLWRRAHPMPLIPFADIVLSVFPIAWIFGRGGCAIVHDHPGACAPAGSRLAVQYPPFGTCHALPGLVQTKTEYGPTNASGQRL